VAFARSIRVQCEEHFNRSLPENDEEIVFPPSAFNRVDR